VFVESNSDGEPLSFDDIKTVIRLEKAKWKTNED
jgi:hypothetical protein